MKGRSGGTGRSCVVVGAGMAGLTAAAYLMRAGFQVRILEKTASAGGHVASFSRQGFVFDTGPRAIGNAGVLRPLIRDLGLDLPLVPGHVSTGIGPHIVHHDQPDATRRFLAALAEVFPDAKAEVRRLAQAIRPWVRRAKSLNSMPNPFFLPPRKDLPRFARDFTLGLPGFLEAVAAYSLGQKTIEQALDQVSSNASLNDMVSQHFFKGTPAGFALGYFANYQDYLYPLGGTGRLSRALAAHIEARGGILETGVEVTGVRPSDRTLRDSRGRVHPYDQLVWCADLNTLYRLTDPAGLGTDVLGALEKRQALYASKKPGESVFTLFLAVDRDPSYFAGISRGHFIHTPCTEGLGELHRSRLGTMKADWASLSKETVLAWVREFCRRNSYEISIPVLKDPSLAPPGKTGLVVSVLADGELFELVRGAGWYQEFRQAFTEGMLDVLDSEIYPGLREKLLFLDSASPLTLRDRFGSWGGAITGWSLEQKPPVPHHLPGLMASPETGLPGIWKAGQWSYSPAGVPTAILTGRVAASQAARAAAPRSGSTPARL